MMLFTATRTLHHARLSAELPSEISLISHQDTSEELWKWPISFVLWSLHRSQAREELIWAFLFGFSSCCGCCGGRMQAEAKWSRWNDTRCRERQAAKSQWGSSCFSLKWGGRPFLRVAKGHKLKNAQQKRNLVFVTTVQTKVPLNAALWQWSLWFTLSKRSAPPEAWELHNSQYEELTCLRKESPGTS